MPERRLAYWIEPSSKRHILVDELREFSVETTLFDQAIDFCAMDQTYDRIYKIQNVSPLSYKLKYYVMRMLI